MKPFAYATARTAESAVALARDDRGRFLAGGIDLLGELKEGLTEAPLLVNVKALPGAQAIAPGERVWTLGANVTVAALAAHDGVRRTFPGLAEAAAEVGSPQIRNVATLGGNLAQHSRCWYYRHRDVVCLKRGGSTCYAREGENRYHALFSGNPCISPIVSNLAIALSALGATAVVQRGGGETARLTMEALYQEAWINPLAHHSLRPEDLIVRVEVPVVVGQRSAYVQMSEKSEFDWALVSCAAAARVEGGRLSGLRLALGQLSPLPHRAEKAERWLEGQPYSEERAARVADALLENATIFAHNAYKVPVARALVKRTLAKLVAA